MLPREGMLQPHILCSQAEAFVEPEPGAIHATCDNPYLPVQAAHRGFVPFACHYDRKSFRFACSDDIPQIAYLPFQYMTIEE